MHRRQLEPVEPEQDGEEDGHGRQRGGDQQTQGGYEIEERHAPITARVPQGNLGSGKESPEISGRGDQDATVVAAEMTAWVV